MKFQRQAKILDLIDRFDIETQEEPVSYTHLDVYKRQALHG